MPRLTQLLRSRSLKRGSPSRRCIVVGVGGNNDDFVRHGAVVMLRSLRATNPGMDVVVFHDGLGSEQRRLLRGFDLRPFDLSRWGLPRDPIPSRPEVDHSTFLLFGLEDLDDYDTAVYIDCDTVILGDLDPIFSMPGEIVATPMDAHPLVEQFRDGARIVQEEGLGATLQAVNAGVIKFDVAYWREIGLREQALDVAERYGWENFRYADQSILNLLGYRAGVLRPMSKLYNFMWWPHMREQQHDLAENGDGYIAPLMHEGFAKVVHWTGPIKPWHQAFRDLPKDDQRLYCGPCYDQFV